MITTVFFDLDGTLSDPSVGFVRGVAAALASIDAPVPENLTSWIGPPLMTSLVAHLGDRNRAQQALAFYRDAGEKDGLAQDRLYDGVLGALDHLADRRLFVCTAKPLPNARKVLAHLGIAGLFGGVFGPGQEDEITDKIALLADAVATTGADPAHAVMIGDRAYDIDAGRAAGMATIGTLYGHGSRPELVAAGATALVDRPSDIPGAIAALGRS